MNEPTNQPTKLETLHGGAELIVKRTDDTAEAVKVRQLPVRLMPQYLVAQDDECKLVELLCDKPAGWSDTLEPGSFELVVTEGERINADFFSRWVQRRLARAERLMPGATEKLMASSVASTSPIGSPR